MSGGSHLDCEDGLRYEQPRSRQAGSLREKAQRSSSLSRRRLFGDFSGFSPDKAMLEAGE